MAAKSKKSEDGNKGIPENAYLLINTQVVPLVREKTTLGRKLDNDLVIQDALISRNHANIRYENGKFMVYDMKSTGGTFVNNKRIDKSELISGDIISLANVPLMFVHDGSTMTLKSDQNTGSLEDQDQGKA